jgi:transposase
MATLASLVASFPALLVPDPSNDARLWQWITDARAADLPHPRSFARGPDLDIQATDAPTLPHHNGRTEGANTKTKMIKRQMRGAPASLCHATASSSA